MPKKSKLNGWIGVDLDGTLANYTTFGDGFIGDPIPRMVERVKRWIDEGYDVRIFTARVTHPEQKNEVQKIKDLCILHLGKELPVTATKDWQCLEIWDDRAVQVLANTGFALGQSRRGLK